MLFQHRRHARAQHALQPRENRNPDSPLQYGSHWLNNQKQMLEALKRSRQKLYFCPRSRNYPNSIANSALSHLTRKALDVLATYLVFPEHRLDEFGSFIEFSLLMIRQS